MLSALDIGMEDVSDGNWTTEWFDAYILGRYHFYTSSDNVTITGGTVTGITDVVADGGTGASDVNGTPNLGVEIGVDVQGYDADLADLADGTLSASKVESGEYFILLQEPMAKYGPRMAMELDHGKHPVAR